MSAKPTRADIEPIRAAIPAARQEAARHYGVHPYFTRRPANVVRTYIERYSRVGDVVLDPFGGSGVTAIEAMVTGRKAIHNDLNPFANFIAATIADTSMKTTAPTLVAFDRVAQDCKEKVLRLETESASAIGRMLKKLNLPPNAKLPSSSDAVHYHEMFTPRQLAGLAIIKEAIDQERKGPARDLLLLAWSAALAKLNKTFLSAKGRAASRGGSSIFSIYRYKIAKDVVELPIWETFEARFNNVLNAKSEVLRIRNYIEHQKGKRFTVDSVSGVRILAVDAAKLSGQVGKSSVDYVFTDPPYGGHIAYLDLSVLWNHWLGFRVSNSARKDEAIVGGEAKLTEDHYKAKLRESLVDCMRMLRPDRWISIVFQHWDLSYFHLILDAVSESGGKLMAAITQDADVIWSMHKKKNSESVLGGEMILTFYKPLQRGKAAVELSAPVQAASVEGMVKEIIASHASAGDTQLRTETIFNEFVMKAWSQRCLGNLEVARDTFCDAVRAQGWSYDPEAHTWSRNGSAPAADQQLLLKEVLGG